ncbi:hypothetical protein C6500_00010 [Candidatus Poribacteria bacterium]|nr:MAG: hypothetical protein C6500_00010 [Candidatus Poribacteria bacterium]
MQASKNLEKFENSNDSAAAMIGFEELALYFQMSDITILIFVGLAIMGIVLSIVLAVYGLGN